MKNLRNLLASLVLFVCVIGITPGCGSTPAKTALVTTVTIKSTADVMFKMWCDYVVAGKATKAQDTQARALYQDYLNAQMLLKTALDSYIVSDSQGKSTIDTVVIMVSNSSAAFVAFVKPLLKD